MTTSPREREKRGSVFRSYGPVEERLASADDGGDFGLPLVRNAIKALLLDSGIPSQSSGPNTLSCSGVPGFSRGPIPIALIFVTMEIRFPPEPRPVNLQLRAEGALDTYQQDGSSVAYV